MSDELNKTLLNILKDARAMVHEYLYTRRETERFDPELGICNAVSRGAPSPELHSGCLILLRAPCGAVAGVFRVSLVPCAAPRRRGSTGQGVLPCLRRGHVEP